ncbi:MAG: class I SAM-dependent methyltransferase [Candidatus Bathyarchaeota archaeon]|nr:MAG: class I SAM-dependent methyltransferase [Candidatus Bathyarchaeota archaeon]
MRGRRVLDAGYGPGVYSEWLFEHGAKVIAVDASQRMVELAKGRLGGSVDVRMFDLRKPLSFIEDASLDLVLASLVMDYVEEWVPIFREFHRVLVGGGVFVFSVGHPFTDARSHGVEDYFRTERVELMWRGFGVPVLMPSYRRPLEAMIEPFSEAGFLVERILEPKPTPEFKEREPEDYERLTKEPGFICIRARKPLRAS